MTNQAADAEDIYKERYAVYLDLLGFTSLVEAAERDRQQQKCLQEVLSLLSQTLCDNPALGSRFSYFSDCMVLTSDVTPEALWSIFRSVELVTRNLLQFDIFVRGAITRGGAFHSQQYVYGTAVSRAVADEKKAKVPLTLISAEVYQDAEKLGQAFLQFIETDGPGRFFVHYLAEYAEYHKTPKQQGTVMLDGDAKRIAFFISRRLINDPEPILEKAVWFQKYWNGTVARQGGFAEIQANPSLIEPDEPPTTIIRRVVG